MKTLPENILSKIPKREREKLFSGNAGLTAAEAMQKFAAGQEKKLQTLIANYLNYHGIYFEWDRMDKRTSGKKGRPDFRICYRGRWIAVECKASGVKLSAEQAHTLAEIRKSGGQTAVAYSLQDVMNVLNDSTKKL